MAIIMALASLNGGTGKTTICHYLGGALASDGSKVLLIDENAFHVLISLLTASDEHDFRSARNKDVVGSKNKINGSRYANLYGIRWCSELAEIARIPLRAREERVEAESRFRDRIRPYDFILIDCPSGHGRRARAGLCVADLALIPTKAEPSGVRDVRRTIRLIERYLIPAKGSRLVSDIVINLRPVRSVD